MVEGNDLLEKVLFENPAKGVQYRLSITEFRGKNYLSIREWYQDFEGDWRASKNGCSFPYELHVVSRLYATLHDLLSEAEGIDEILDEEIFYDES